jgi:transposase InsO family protein
VLPEAVIDRQIAGRPSVALFGVRAGHGVSPLLMTWTLDQFPGATSGRRCKAKDVVAVLEELTSLYPAPAFIRSDNGPEFIASALKRLSEASGTTTAYIEPGSPWQNGFAESFNSRFRDEFLNTELFNTVAEAQALADRLR